MISKEEFKNLALLSKLVFSQDEEEKLRKEFDSIIEFADTVRKFSTEDEAEVDEKRTTPLREDEILPSYSQEDILKNAAYTEDGFFHLPESR